MLHRSFKAGKCKTSLKLATARIKLLRNKRNSQLIQMKRDLSQLLETGQEKTARIRVEHVVREEKTMSAYDLIDIYCELIVARLPIIESQKTCPIDLKEAITSVIFAAPRCADVPELLDVRKHFTAKYGKEFITAALELRPDCSVNRTMVEKLSARAPDGETKMKILAKIAQEHNINWDPNASAEEELKPPEELPKGPSTFVSTSKPVEAPAVHQSPTPGQNYESSVDTEKRSSLTSQDYASANARFTMAKPNSAPFESRASETHREETEFRDSPSNNKNTMSFNRQHWNMEFKDATSAAQAAAESAERASMAARAAAELSSLGRYTRQSPAELHESSGYDLQDEEPEISAGPSLRGQHETVRMMNSSQVGSFQSVDPRIQPQQRGRNDIHNQQGSAGSIHDSRSHSSQNVDARMQAQRSRKDMHNQQGSGGNMHDSQSYSSQNVDPRIQDHRGRIDTHNQQGSSMYNAYGSINRRSRQPVSPSFTTASVDDYDMVNNDQREDRYYQRRSSDVESDNTSRQGRKGDTDNLLRDISRKKQPSQSHVEYIDQPKENQKTEYSNSSAEEKMRNRSSKSLSSHYRLSSDDDEDTILDPNIQNDRNYAREHSFSNTDLGNVQKGTKQLSSSDYHDAHLDGYGSEEDHVEADVYNVHDSDFYVPSPARESHSSQTTTTRNSRPDRSESQEHDASVQSDFIVESHSPASFRETPTTMPSESFELLPVTFDDSDGLSEEEIDNYKSSGRAETSSLPLEHDIFTRVQEPSQIESVYGSQKFSTVEKETAKDSQKPWLYSSYDDDDLESEDRHPGTTSTVRRNVGGESVKRYSGHGSTKSSFTENEKEGIRTHRKSRLPSSSDDSESESVYSLNNQAQVDGGDKARKKYGHAVLPSPNRTSQALRPNVGGESANSYSRHGSKKPSFIDNEAAGAERKPKLPSSSDDSEPESARSSKNQEAHLDVERESQSKYGHGGLLISSPRRSPRNSYQEVVLDQGGSEERQTMKASRFHSATEMQTKDELCAPISPDAIKDLEPRSFSRAESGQGLNFGRLTGGIKNKVISRRTYNREPSNDVAPPSRQQTVEYTPTLNEKSTASPKFKPSTIPQAQDQEVQNQKQQKELRQELSSRSPRTFFDSDSDEAEAPPLRTVSSKGYTTGRISRVKKDYPDDPDTSRLSTSSVGSDVSFNSRFALRRNGDSSVQQRTPKSMPQPDVSVHRESPRLQKRHQPVEQQPSQPVPEPEVIAPVSIKTVTETTASGSTHDSKPSLSKEGETSRENSFKKAGHVHPKLPDYDSFAAHFEALRSNRR